MAVKGGAAVLDRLCNLLCFAFDAPMSVVSVLENDEVRHVARRGVEFQLSPISGSFTARVLAEGRVWCVPNTAADPDWSRHAFVVGAPYVRAYAGAPILGPDGRALGVVAVVDTAPFFKFSDDKRTALEDAATLAGAFLAGSVQSGSAAL